MRTLKLTKDSQKNIMESLLKRSTNNYTQYETKKKDIIKINSKKKIYAYFI